MIEDFYNTSFVVSNQAQAQVGGRLEKTYTPQSTSRLGALFTPSTSKTVRLGKVDYIITKTLYTDPGVDVELGDLVTVDSKTFFVVSKNDTNNLNHHLVLGLTSRD